jgi:hypothetical protein
MSDVEQFARLFRGREDVIGHAKGYNGPISEKRPVTLVDYESHLAGDGVGIGIYPMLDDDTCWFAAIDLDEPDFELARTMQKLIPGQSWIERSKSGNAHVWVFFDQPAEAWAVRSILRGATQSVGRSEVEVFPKQDGLRADMVGNFINLPYHGDTRPMLYEAPEYAPPGDLQDVTLASFLKSIEFQNPEAWVRRARAIGGQPPSEREPGTEFGQQPNLHMCAEYIMEHRFDNPLTTGHRSVVLFNLARQFLNWRDCTVQEARRWVHEMNDAATAPAPEGEVDRQFDNALSGKWTGTGCDDPVMAPYVHPDCPIAKGEVGR